MTKLLSYFATVALLLITAPTQALVVLQYHHIASDTPAVTSISPEGFAEHMALLEQEGMVIVDLLDAMTRLRAGETLPAKAVAITFDDAYQSIFDNAYPLLKERQWPFTVFVNTLAVDQNHNSVMSWDALREMSKNKGLIANHAQSHPYFVEPPQGQDVKRWYDREINGAEARIRQEIGVSHKLFAYPYGEFTLELAHWLKEQGYIAFGQQSGAIGAHSHMQALPRYPAAGVYANPKTLRTKLYTLALPIDEKQFVEQVLGRENPPALTLRFNSSDLYPRQIQCYSGAEGAIATQVSTNDQRITVQTQASKPIRDGRDRYNCTAPSKSHPGWYYWYSQPWVNTSVKNR